MYIMACHREKNAVETYLLSLPVDHYRLLITRGACVLHQIFKKTLVLFGMAQWMLLL